MSENTEKFPFLYQASHGELFGLYIKNMMLSVFTLGIYSFWGRVEISQYIYRSLGLRGRPFGYHATGKELFVGFLKGMGIVIGVVVVLAILSAVLGAKVATVLYALLYVAFIFVVTPWLLVGKLRFWLSRSSWSNIRFRFVGTASDLGKQWWKWMLLLLVTLGFYTPVYVNRLQRFYVDNIRFGNLAFSYEGKSSTVYKIMAKGVLLSIVTLGIYLPWFQVELNNYMLRNTKVAGNPLDSTMTGGGMFVLSLTNLLMVIFTFGLCIPIAMNRQMHYFFGNLNITMDPEALDAAIGISDPGASSTATGLEQAAEFADAISSVL